MVLGVHVNFYFWLRKVTKNLLSAEDDVVTLNIAKANRLLQGLPEDPFEEFEEKLERHRKNTQATSARTHPTAPVGDGVPGRCPLRIVSATATVPGLLHVGMAVLRGGRITVSQVRVVLQLLPVRAAASSKPSATASAHHPSVGSTHGATQSSASPVPTPAGASAEPAMDSNARMTDIAADSDVGLMALLNRVCVPVADKIVSSRLASVTEIEIESLIIVLRPPPCTSTTAAPPPAEADKDVLEMRLSCRHIRAKMQSSGAGARQVEGVISVEALHVGWYRHADKTLFDTAALTNVVTAQSLLRCLGGTSQASPRTATTATTATTAPPPACTVTVNYAGAADGEGPHLDLTVRACPVEVVLAAGDVIALQRLSAYLTAYPSSSVLPRSTAREPPPNTTGATSAADPRPPPPLPPAAPSVQSALHTDVFAHADGLYVSVLLSAVPDASREAEEKWRSSFWGPGRHADVRACVTRAWRTAAATTAPAVALLHLDLYGTPHLTLAAENVKLVRPSPAGGHDVSRLLCAHGETRLRGRWEPLVASLGSPAITSALSNAGPVTQSPLPGTCVTGRVAVCYVGGVHVWQHLEPTTLDSPREYREKLPPTPLFTAQRDPCALLIVHRAATSEADTQQIRLSETVTALTAKAEMTIAMGFLVPLGLFAQNLGRYAVRASTAAGTTRDRPRAATAHSPLVEPTSRCAGGLAYSQRVCLVHGLSVTVAITPKVPLSATCSHQHRHRVRTGAGSLRVELTNVQLTSGAIPDATVWPQGRAEPAPVASRSPSRVSWHGARVLFRPDLAPTFPPTTPTADGNTMPQSVPSKPPPLSSSHEWATLVCCPGGPDAHISVESVTEVETNGSNAISPAHASTLAVSVHLGDVFTGALTMLIYHTLLPWLNSAMHDVGVFRRQCTVQTATAPSTPTAPPRTRGNHRAHALPPPRTLWHALIGAEDATRTRFHLRVARLHVTLLAPRLAWDGTAFGAPLIYHVLGPGATSDTEAVPHRVPDHLTKCFHHYTGVLDDVDVLYRVCTRAPSAHVAMATRQEAPLHQHMTRGAADDVRLRVFSMTLSEVIPRGSLCVQSGLEGPVRLVERVPATGTHTRAVPVLDIHMAGITARFPPAPDEKRSPNSAVYESVTYQRLKARLAQVCVHHLPAHAGDTWVAALTHFFTTPASLRCCSDHEYGAVAAPTKHTSPPSSYADADTLLDGAGACLHAVHQEVELRVHDVLWCTVPLTYEQTTARPGEASQRQEGPTAATLVVLAPALHMTMVLGNSRAQSTEMRVKASVTRPAYVYIAPQLTRREDVLRCLRRDDHSAGCGSAWGVALQDAGFHRVAEVLGDAAKAGEPTAHLTAHSAGSDRVLQACISHLHVAIFVTPWVIPALADVCKRFSDDGAVRYVENPAVLVVESDPQFAWVAHQAQRLAAPVTVTVDKELFLSTQAAATRAGSTERCGPASETTMSAASLRRQVRRERASTALEGEPRVLATCDADVEARRGYEAYVLPLLTGQRWRDQVRTRPLRRERPHSPSMGSFDFTSLPSTPRIVGDATASPSATRGAHFSLSSAIAPAGTAHHGGKTPCPHSLRAFSDVDLVALGRSADRWCSPCAALTSLDAACARHAHYLSLLSRRYRTVNCRTTVFEEAVPPSTWPESAASRQPPHRDRGGNAGRRPADGAAASVSVLLERCPLHVVLVAADTGAWSNPFGANTASAGGRCRAPISTVTEVLAQLRLRRTRARAPTLSMDATAVLSCLLLEVAGLKATLDLYEEGSLISGIQRALTLTVEHVRVLDFSVGRAADTGSATDRAGDVLLSYTPADPADWPRAAPLVALHWHTTVSPRRTLRHGGATAAMASPEETVSLHLHPSTLRLTESSLYFYRAFTAAMRVCHARAEAEKKPARDAKEPCAGSRVVATPPLFFRRFTLAPTALTVASTESTDRALMSWLLQVASWPVAKMATHPLGLFLRLDGVTLRVPLLTLVNADAPLLARKLSDAIVVAITAQLGSLAEQLVRPVRSATEVGAAALQVIQTLCQRHTSLPARVFNTTQATSALWLAGRAQVLAGASFASGTAAQWAHALAKCLLLHPRDASPSPSSAPGSSIALSAALGGLRQRSADDDVTAPVSVLDVRVAQARHVLSNTAHSPPIRLLAATLLVWVGVLEGLAASLDAAVTSTSNTINLPIGS